MIRGFVQNLALQHYNLNPLLKHHIPHYMAILGGIHPTSRHGICCLGEQSRVHFGV